MQIAAVNQRIAAMEHEVADENKKRTNKQQKSNPRGAQML